MPYVVCAKWIMSPASIQPPVRSKRVPSNGPPFTVASCRWDGPWYGDSRPSAFQAKNLRMVLIASPEPVDRTIHDGEVLSSAGTRTR